MSSTRSRSPVFSWHALAGAVVIFSLIPIRICAEERKSRPTEELDQQISCRPGQALSDISWTEDSDHFKHYINCANYTDSCNEMCQWTVACTVSYYGQGVYVRGVRAIYDNVNYYQRILFLCCNSSVSMARHCDGKMKELTGNSARKETGGRRSFRQARQDKSKDGHSTSLLVEPCTSNASNMTLC